MQEGWEKHDASSLGWRHRVLYKLER
jgi:hypothetical protein